MIMKFNRKMIIFNVFLIMVLCGVFFMSRSMEAQAYEESRHHVDEEGNWEVDDADGPSVSVSLYMMVQPDYADSAGFRTYYSFFCTEGEFYYTDGRYEDCEPMIYFFRSENAKVVDTIDDLEVWYWEFNIEPGKYLFSNPEGLGYLTVLTQSLGSPFVRDGYTKAEETVVEEGDHVRLYSMLGDWEWRSAPEQLESLMKYANQREEELTYGHPELQKKKNEEESTPTPDKNEISKSEDMKEFESGDNNNTTYSSEEQQSIEKSEEKPEEKPEGNKGISTGNILLFMVIVLIIGVGIAFYYYSKKGDNSSK